MVDTFIGKNCNRCAGSDLVLDYKAGDIICRECGEVATDRFIDQGNEVIMYADNDGKSQSSRSSGMVELHATMATMFVNGPENIRKSLEKAQLMSADRKEMSIVGNLGLLNEMCAKLNLIRTIQDAAIDLFSKSVTQNVDCSKRKDVLVASCIYLACRLQGYPRTIDEIARHTGVKADRISKRQTLIARALSLPIGQAQASPESLVGRIAAQLQLSHTVASHARTMCVNIARYELFSATPQSVLGGVLLWVCLLQHIPLDVSVLCELLVTPHSTLRNMFGKIHSSIAVVASEELLDACESRGVDWRDLSENLDKHTRNNKLIVKIKLPNSVSTTTISASSTLLVSSSASNCSPASISSEDSSSTSLSTATSTESINSIDTTCPKLIVGAGVSDSAATSSLNRNMRRRGCSSEFVKEHGSIFIPKKKVRRI